MSAVAWGMAPLTALNIPFQVSPATAGNSRSLTKGDFINGPAMTLELIDNELTLALSDGQFIMAQFFQCAKP